MSAVEQVGMGRVSFPTRLSVHPARSIWIPAIIVALTLHVSAFAFMWLKNQETETDDALGAPAIEIGLELTAPPQEQNDLPPGPEAEASTASVAVAEQHEKVEKVDAPKEQPKEADDPDRLVAPDTAKTQKDETPQKTETKANMAADSVASEAMAPPKLDAARVAVHSAAPAQGSGDSAKLVITSWQKQLVAHLNRFKRYPDTGTRHAVQIVVTFTLDRLGHVVAASVKHGSGEAAFDQAALTMMHKADPVPPPPPVLADDGLTFTLPVIFRNKHG